ncbi:MAG: hypothetical protein GWQ05_28515 [Verrucomicrobiaceae bacterium]|nr:hypothetical protein [Verrucomicrobiaceae bacterium]
MPTKDEEMAFQSQAVDACWEGLRSLPLVEQTWPTNDTIPACEALLRWAPEIHERLTTKHTLIHKFGVVPISAVVGLLNSGKSSLTASFLSQKNRDRVLRGVGQCEGSQRFTLWVPQSWKDDQSFFANLLELLTRVFECEPETLSDEDGEARRQQNDLTQLACPLIGTDTALSTLKLAILDCPDIQRANNDDATKSRLEVVRRASEICAAVFVVFARSQVEIKSLQAILEAMPDAQRIHAVNLIKDDPAEIVRNEVAEVLGLQNDALIYGAYDFLSTHYDARTPTWDTNRPLSSLERLDVSSPCFFKLDSQPESNKPTVITEDRSIRALAKELTPHAIKSRRMKELLSEFYADLETGVHRLETMLTESSNELSAASLKLRSSCQGLLTEGGRIRITMSPEILQSVEASLTRTAPRMQKILLLPVRRVFKSCEGFIAKAKDFSILPGKELKEKKAELERSLGGSKSGVAASKITAEDVQRVIALWSGSLSDYQPAKRWKGEAEEILARFQAEDRSDLTRREWDELTSQFWKKAPKRGITKSIILMLVGLLLVVVDGGTSLVVLTVDAIGVSGMLASLGLGAKELREFQEVLDSKLGLRQVSNFHAIVCDIIGLPRDRDNGDLPIPTVETKLNQPSYGVTERDWSLHQLNETSLNALRSHGL